MEDGEGDGAGEGERVTTTASLPLRPKALSARLVSNPLVYLPKPLIAHQQYPVNTSLQPPAYSQGPIRIAWTKQLPVSLGTGFSSAAGNSVDGDPFRGLASAFDASALHQQDILFHPQDAATGTYLSNVSTSLSQAYDHLSLALGVGIGNDFIGASVSGSYDKSVLRNTNQARTSRRASFEVGAFRCVRTPPLAPDASAFLGLHGYGAFVQRYGDYYASAFTLGGEAGVLFSSSSYDARDSDTEKITAEGHLACFSDEVTIADHESSNYDSRAAFAVTAYDSLDESFIDLPSLDTYSVRYREARAVARDYNDRVENLPDRVQAKFAALPDVGTGTRRISWKDVRMLEESGLILKVVLTPFAVHPQVRAALVKAIQDADHASGGR